MRIYFAAPLFTQAEWLWNEQIAIGLRELGYEVFLPQDFVKPVLKDQADELDTQKIFVQNISELENSHVIVAIFDQSDPDSGTSWECGYAFKTGLPIVGIRTDLRKSGDVPALSINLMLYHGCAAFIDTPLDKRDNVEWLTGQIHAKIKEVTK